MIDFRLSKEISIIIVISAVTFVFTSNLIGGSGSFALAKPDNRSKDILKKIRETLGDSDDEINHNEISHDEPEEKQEVKKDYNYNFVAENDNNLKNFNFAAAGDFSCSQDAKETIHNMLVKKPELVLPLGDLAVEDNTANCWLDLISPFENKLQITFGYHELNEGAAKIEQYKKVFGLNKLYYSFDYGRVHFIVMSTLSDANVTSDQYRFIENNLKVASENKNIDWIVVTSYAPFYTSVSEHPAKKVVRNIYHPLFDKYGVDLVLTAHNHNYQRTYPVTFNPYKRSDPTITNGFTTGYTGNKDGVVYVIVGTAGEPPVHPLLSRQPYVATQVSGKFGFLNVEISNDNSHTKMAGTFYNNEGGNIEDYFTIQKEIKNTKQKSNYLNEYSTTSNIVPVDKNKATSSNYNILPTYSKADEK